MANRLAETKREVAIANRILSATGLATGHRISLGHASMRVPDQPDRFVVKGRGYRMDALPAMRPEDMILCDLEGNLVDGPPGATQCFEVKIHSCVYKLNPEVNAVVHVCIPDALIAEMTGRTPLAELPHFREPIARASGTPRVSGVWQYYAQAVSGDL